MVMPMSWEIFLKTITDFHCLTADQTEALLARLAEKNRGKSETAVAIDMDVEIPAFKKRMTAVYEKFAPSCPELKSRGRGKFEKLRAWLVKNYQQWKETGKLDLPKESEKPEDTPSNTIEANKSLYRDKPSLVGPPPQHIASNPFGKQGRITDPKEFFDRTDLLHKLFELLEKGSNCSLVGESEIGKSSILSMVCKWGSERLQLSPDAFIYLNMQIIHNEEQFFQALCDELKIETRRGYELARALQGKRYILCIDEIEKMTSQEHFTGNERSELRGLAEGSDSPFTLVIASRSPLNELFPDSDGMTSPLYNICRRLDVKPFSHDEARDFLKHRLRGTGVSFTDSQIDQLLKNSECHPARLQNAAAELYDAKLYDAELYDAELYDAKLYDKETPA